MTTPAERVSHLDLIAQLRSSFTDLPEAPPPDLIDHERYTAYVKTVHDVGGEPTVASKFENKQYEGWEENTYVTCEVLGWRGIWLSEERRRIGNVDVGRTIYLGLPYYGRWLLAAARILVEKHHITLGELSERMAEVKARYQGGLTGKTLAAKPKSEGDGSQVKRNRHNTHAVGKGDPQVY
ncbi:MAG TPA: nitrile hydratase subunit beta, partial [Mycobacterium sp.]|nr:nitrile hydratase subunit beta [Mycobacterium sp.]